MIVVGLNAYHGDASACLVRDGKAMLLARWVSATWVRLREGRVWMVAAEVPVYAFSFMLVFIFLRPINQFIYFQF